MICPKCQDDMTEVIDSRVMPYGVRRRRECLVCDHRWTTVEIDVDQYKTLQRIARSMREITQELGKMNNA